MEKYGSAICIDFKGSVLFSFSAFSLHSGESAPHVKSLNKVFGCRGDDVFSPLLAAALGLTLAPCSSVVRRSVIV